MSYVLILDDTRSIEEVLNMTPKGTVPDLPKVLCKDFKAAQKHIMNAETPAQHVCFDWNLYGSPNHMELTGLDFARWLTHYDCYRKQLLAADFTFSVHSSDADRAKEIFEVMKEHQEEKREVMKQKPIVLGITPE